jgi:hypothetical protein
MSLHETLLASKSGSAAIKAAAQQALTDLAGTVDTTWTFRFLDNMRMLIAAGNTWRSVSGIDAFATAQLPGYAGTFSADIAAMTSAAQACIDWIVANFPKDSTATWILAEQLNPDGSRTARTFTSVQTAGLRTAVTNFIATIG